MATFSWVDYLIIGIFFVSILVGLWRGLVREVLALVTWIAAFIVAILFSGRVAEAFSGSQHMQSVISSTSTSVGMNTSQSVSMLAMGASFVGLFILTLIVGALITRIIAGAVESQGISFINRLLGGVFGLARGVLVILLMIFLVQLSPLIQQQAVWNQSKFVIAFQPTVQWLNGIVEPGLKNLKSKVDESLKNVDMQGIQDKVTTLYQNTQKKEGVE